MKYGNAGCFRYNNDGDNWKITREISRDNTSKWSVNSRPSTQKAVSLTSVSSALLLWPDNFLSNGLEFKKKKKKKKKRIIFLHTYRKQLL